MEEILTIILGVSFLLFLGVLFTIGFADACGEAAGEESIYSDGEEIW